MCWLSVIQKLLSIVIEIFIHIVDLTGLIEFGSALHLYFDPTKDFEFIITKVESLHLEPDRGQYVLAIC